MNAPDTATVRAIYATTATYRQSPDTVRVAAFDAWLSAVKAEARANGYEDGHDDGYKSGWDAGYKSGREGVFYMMEADS